ncbi:hypothetical protein MEG1DRAFT_00109 [Photorhabdus temperata subsp. temperata Meg1]|uniref:Uncharacterized protein n=2 Tax=Photorhabdus temperata TaxID=574560 RepID=A0A081S2R1_PHOTE|nr:hypothetical protein O185_21165 [Photorhabdus temperata J3]KER05214.1 hypothetical protein MEG1DRAFT_00109 [Photorhabdus temperata subsp. temperata Meg1]
MPGMSVVIFLKNKRKTFVMVAGNNRFQISNRFVEVVSR